MSEIGSQLAGILSRVREASRATGSKARSVVLIAVSKTFTADDIREAIAAGHRVFGESRLQEAEPKIRSLTADLEWHFIGRLQRNKVRRILLHFTYVHAVDSLRLATYMNRVAADLGLRPQVFLQIDLAGEDSKGGFDMDELRSEFGAIKELTDINVVGLMVIPPAARCAEESRKWFQQLRIFREELEVSYSTSLPFLSMGMSEDFEVAVQEGATHVRVGSAIFGSRLDQDEEEHG